LGIPRPRQKMTPVSTIIQKSEKVVGFKTGMAVIY